MIGRIQTAHGLRAIVEPAVEHVAISVQHLAAHCRSIADRSADDGATPSGNDRSATARALPAACACAARACAARTIASDTVVYYALTPVGCVHIPRPPGYLITEAVTRIIAPASDCKEYETGPTMS